MNDRIIFDNVSKFYGEIVGVNRVSLSIPPGITTESCRSPVDACGGDSTLPVHANLPSGSYKSKE